MPSCGLEQLHTAVRRKVVEISGECLPHVPSVHVPLQQSTVALQLSPSSEQVSTDLGGKITIGTSTMSTMSIDYMLIYLRKIARWWPKLWPRSILASIRLCTHTMLYIHYIGVLNGGFKDLEVTEAVGGGGETPISPHFPSIHTAAKQKSTNVRDSNQSRAATRAGGHEALKRTRYSSVALRVFSQS